jgi:hypothetical protein
MTYRVYLHSKPSPALEFYNGYVDVEAENDVKAEDAAIHKLSRGTFRDRGYGAWIVERVERKAGAR